MKMLTGILSLLLIPTLALSTEDVAVTVYNSNLGVVSEVRSLDFEKGTGQVAFTDVPAQIDAASVRFTVLGSAGQVGILEQNYAFDLVNTSKIYSRYVDKEITLIDKEGKLYTGTLLSSDSRSVVLQGKDGAIKIVQMDNIAEVDFPSLPEGLITRPTLFWLYTSDYSGTLDCNVSYQTSGMEWAAEYVGVVNDDETQLDLSGWASITNQTTKTFADAQLKLIAGDISRAEAKGRRPELARMSAGAGMEDAGFQEKAFFEYHMYTLPRKATLAANEVKQISLFEPATTAVKKEYIYRPERNAEQVEVALNFTNSRAAGLGMPLPEGRVRLFKADEDGSLILLGEDRVDHTPRDEELDLRVGYAFDIAAEERMMNQTRISQRVEDRDFEVELRNRKDETVTVTVEKRLYGSWEILESNFTYEKKDAYTVEFEIPVAAGEEVILRYKVRFTR